MNWPWLCLALALLSLDGFSDVIVVLFSKASTQSQRWEGWSPAFPAAGAHTALAGLDSDGQWAVGLCCWYLCVPRARKPVLFVGSVWALCKCSCRRCVCMLVWSICGRKYRPVSFGSLKARLWGSSSTAFLSEWSLVIYLCFVHRKGNIMEVSNGLLVESTASVGQCPASFRWRGRHCSCSDL